MIYTGCWFATLDYTSVADANKPFYNALCTKQREQVCHAIAQEMRQGASPYEPHMMMV